MGFNQALQMIERNGGKVSEKDVTIKYHPPVPVRYEKAFEGLYPVKKTGINKQIADVGEFSFEGTGVVFKGSVNARDREYVARAEMYMDGQLVETANLPANYTARRHDLFWKYQLPKGQHVVTFKWLNPEPEASVRFGDVLIYSDAPFQITHQ